MHEWGLVADALAELTSQTPGPPPGTITFRLGPRADAGTVRAAWEQLTADGPLRGSELVLEHDDDLLRCLDCELEFRGCLPDQCPDCRGDGLVIETAADLALGAQDTAASRGSGHAAATPGGGKP